MCLPLMNAVHTGQRLTTGAAIAGFVAAVLARGAPAVSEAPKVPEMNVGTTPPPDVAKAVPEKRCFEALRPVLAKPGWKITIERGMYDCGGSRPNETFDIDSDGHVLWRANGMPDRRIELSLGERPLLEGIVGVSCQRELESAYEMAFLRIYPAGTSRDDADSPMEWSPARETLEMLILRLKTRYADERRENLGTITVDVRMLDENSRAWYRARIADDILLVTRGARVVMRKALAKEEIIALVDGVGFQAPGPGNDARGSLGAGEKTIAVVPEDLPYLGHAIYCDTHHDEPWICP